MADDATSTQEATTDSPPNKIIEVPVAPETPRQTFLDVMHLMLDNCDRKLYEGRLSKSRGQLTSYESKIQRAFTDLKAQYNEAAGINPQTQIPSDEQIALEVAQNIKYKTLELDFNPTNVAVKPADQTDELKQKFYLLHTFDMVPSGVTADTFQDFLNTLPTLERRSQQEVAVATQQAIKNGKPVRLTIYDGDKWQGVHVAGFYNPSLKIYGSFKLLFDGQNGKPTADGFDLILGFDEENVRQVVLNSPKVQEVQKEKEAVDDVEMSSRYEIARNNVFASVLYKPGESSSYGDISFATRDTMGDAFDSWWDVVTDGLSTKGKWLASLKATTSIEYPGNPFNRSQGLDYSKAILEDFRNDARWGNTLRDLSGLFYFFNKNQIGTDCIKEFFPIWATAQSLKLMVSGNGEQVDGFVNLLYLAKEVDIVTPAMIRKVGDNLRAADSKLFAAFENAQSAQEVKSLSQRKKLQSFIKDHFDEADGDILHRSDNPPVSLGIMPADKNSPTNFKRYYKSIDQQ